MRNRVPYTVFFLWSQNIVWKYVKLINPEEYKSYFLVTYMIETKFTS